MKNLKEILASLDKEALKALQDIIDSKDDAKLQDYVTQLFDQYAKEDKVEESCNKITSSAKDEVLAYVNTKNYEWYRFRGLRSKSIPYAGMVVKLQPKDIIGIAKVIDFNGKYRVVIPSYKHSYISLPKEIVDVIRIKCRPFNGNLDFIFKTATQRELEKI